MTTCYWITLGVGIFIIVAAIATLVKYPKAWCEYWGKDWQKVKPYWSAGWILDVLHVLFWFLDKLTIINIITFCITKIGIRRRWSYIFVDTYVIVLFITELYLLFSFVFPIPTLVDTALLAFISWRLFGIFRVWTSHFIIGRYWSPVNLYRTLILVFISYLEVIICYTILAFVLQKHFEGIDSLQKALFYSISNAATIGSNFEIKDCIGYSLFASQIMFVILFLTAVISRIISRKESA